MSERIYINNDWKFAPEFEESMLRRDYEEQSMETVRIPHTVKETAFNYFDEKVYQMVSGYRKTFLPEKNWKEKRTFLTFEGAAHQAEVYLNGKLLGSHACGYTAFTVELTDFLEYDCDNVITVKLDSRESLNIPPFGHVVDYMTYGGIYRDVYLEVRENCYLQDVFVKPYLPETFVYEEAKQKENVAAASLVAEVRIAGRMTEEKQSDQAAENNHSDRAETQSLDDQYMVRLSLKKWKAAEQKAQTRKKEYYDTEKILYESKLCLQDEKTADRGGNEGSWKPSVIQVETEPVSVWDVCSPTLYLLRVELLLNGSVIDEKEIRFGFRKAEFRTDGFYLNGRKFKIRGLNRHQSFPYVGYAMPESMQRADADILKKELGVNAVRTSHYPQSHYFIDRCEELGLLVFMEFPGWQHIGDADWKEQALVNLKEMILQYRNHSSIIIWGVRINESADDDEFYERTNKLARELDDYRPTGGVRASKKSHLLEDVYTYNDFVHDGKAPGCEPKDKVTSDTSKPYLITEYNGHMYPTKNQDCEEHRMEHAIRHANVLDAVAGSENISGSFGWCMFDYNTHKDFGSGDRICYHGVMDMFRNPKMAADVYACQNEEQTVLSVSSSMDIGEHPGCNRGNTWIFTNADSVKMYKNDVFIKEFKAEESPYRNLKHGPILINDFIGDQIRKHEKFKPKQAEEIKTALNAAALYGLGNLPFKIKMTAVKMVLLYHMKPEQAVTLYNRYIGDWGGTVTAYKFEAVKDGHVVKTIYKQPVEAVHLLINTDHTVLKEGNSYDVASVRMRAADENGNVLPYYEEPAELVAEGPVEIIGPKVITFRGGMTGTYVRTTGEPGKAKLHIRIFGMTEETIDFEVRK